MVILLVLNMFLFYCKLQICCFPSLGKKPVLSEEMSALTTNSSDAFLQNLAHLRNNRENTPTNSSNCGTKEEIVLLEKQGRSSQKLRSNLAQVSTMIGQNMTDISNIGNQSKVGMICNKKKCEFISIPII